MPTHQPRPTGGGTFRVLVTGSRTWTDTDAITTALDQLHARHGDGLRVVHGACPDGADAIADLWAVQRRVPVETHPADWRTGRAAGPRRNVAMVESHPDACLAFIADNSRGATGTADLAEAAGIPTTRTPSSTRAAATDASTPSNGNRPGHGDGRLVAQDDDQLIAVENGPLVGQWFTWDDWQQRLRAAAHTHERTGHRSPVLDYAPAGYQISHPVLDHTHGWAATYRPAAEHVSDDPATGTSTAHDDSAAAHDDRADDDDTLDLAG